MNISRNKNVAIVRLDIFKDIGLGHLSRMKQLAIADNFREYILIYRSDIKDLNNLFEDIFFKTIRIYSKSYDFYWSSFGNNITSLEEIQIEDCERCKEQMNIISFDYSIDILIIDNFAINQSWIDNLRDDNKWNKLKLLHLDDCNKCYSKTDLSIMYNCSRNNLLINSCGEIRAEGLMYAPLGPNFIKARELIHLNKLRNSILISFGFFDELEISYNLLKHLNKYRDIEINVIISKEASSFSRLLNEFSKDKNINLIDYSSNIVELYQKSFFSLGSFGLMSIEKAYLCIPQINIVEANNQENTKQTLLDLRLSDCFQNVEELFKIDYDHKRTCYYEESKQLIHRSDNIFGNGILEWVKLINLLCEREY